MTSSTIYHLPQAEPIWSHFPFPARPAVVRDGLDDFDVALRVQARVRSGDYLMTLATELERLARGIADPGSPEAAELDRLVQELLYINKHFDVRKRT